MISRSDHGLLHRLLVPLLPPLQHLTSLPGLWGQQREVRHHQYRHHHSPSLSLSSSSLSSLLVLRGQHGEGHHQQNQHHQHHHHQHHYHHIHQYLIIMIFIISVGLSLHLIGHHLWLTEAWFHWSWWFVYFLRPDRQFVLNIYSSSITCFYKTEWFGPLSLSYCCKKVKVITKSK